MKSRGLWHRVRRPAWVVLVLAACGATVAQEVRLPRDPTVYRIVGQDDEKFLGDDLLTLGDVDGDGVRDFASGTTLHVGEDDVRTRVHVFSGKTGTRLRTWESPKGGFVGIVEAFPDLDGDGSPELGIWDTPGEVKVLSAATGETWYTFWGLDAQIPPWRVEILPDLDGDGIEEFVAPYAEASTGNVERAGALVLHSGKRGAPIIWSRRGSIPEGYFGSDVTPAGDHDADGYPDLLVRGALTQEDDREKLVLWILDGRTGESLRRYEPDWDAGVAVGTMITLPDQDGNGFPEVAIAAPFYGEAFNRYGDGKDRGWVGIYRLPGFELIRSFTGRDPHGIGDGDWLGWKLALAGDVDGDGFEDFLMNTWGAHPDILWHSRLYLHSGVTGDVLMVYEAKQQSAGAFTSMGPLGDVDGDGRAEFLAGNSNQILHDEFGNRIFGRGAILALRYEPEGAPYVRGDVNADGRVNLTDAVAIFNTWLEREPPACPAAFDVMGEGWVGPEDSLWLLEHLFGFAPSPVPPFPECGRFTRIDPTDLSFRVLPCDGPEMCPGG